MPSSKRSDSSRSKDVPKTKPAFLRWVAVIITVALVLGVGGVIFSRMSQGAKAQTESEILAGFLADSQKTSEHEILSVAQAGALFTQMISGKVAFIASCPEVQIYPKIGRVNLTDGTVLAVQPQSVGLSDNGDLVLVEMLAVEPTLWAKVPENDKWSYIWHESQHIRQDCELLQQVAEPSLNAEALWNSFNKEWEARRAIDEAYPLAIQGYWQQHGRRILFPAIDTLLARQPGAWSKELTIGTDGLPIGIEQQPEWSKWIENVGAIYVPK